MSPHNFRKISYLELEIFLYWHNFSKEVSQLPDCQILKKFIFIWIKCANIPGKPIKIKKTYHPEQEISLYWPNFSEEMAN